MVMNLYQERGDIHWYKKAKRYNSRERLVVGTTKTRNRCKHDIDSVLKNKKIKMQQ